MSFWKFMAAFMITYFIQAISYSRLAFFQSDLSFSNGFSWLELGKFGIDIAIFAGIFYGSYNLIDKVPEWRMRRRYEKAQKERA